MSVSINLNDKKVKFPSNFFENESLLNGELMLNKKETYWNSMDTLYTLPKILLKVRTNSSNLTNISSNINVVEIQKKGLHSQNSDSKSKLTKNFNQNSQLPFLNLLLFEGNNTYVCYLYYSQNFNYPNISIIGEPEKIHVLYFYQNNTDSAYYDTILIDDGSLLYKSIANCPDCTDCPKCPEIKCPDCPQCPETECPDCPDIKPYTYSLYACGSLIFVLLLILSYLVIKGNNEKNIK